MLAPPVAAFRHAPPTACFLLEAFPPLTAVGRRYVGTAFCAGQGAAVGHRPRWTPSRRGRADPSGFRPHPQEDAARSQPEPRSERSAAQEQTRQLQQQLVGSAHKQRPQSQGLWAEGASLWGSKGPRRRPLRLPHPPRLRWLAGQAVCLGLRGLGRHLHGTLLNT